jgi:hypothetical protein
MTPLPGKIILSGVVLWIIIIIVLLFIRNKSMEPLYCPLCDNLIIRAGHGYLFWFLVIILFPAGLLLLLIKSTYICPKCGHKFKA